MKAIRSVLVAGLAATSIIGAILGSCAVDDDITWITDPDCTVNCSPENLAGYSCDTDSTCTEAPGCTDWDCTDRVNPAPDADVTTEVPRADADATPDGPIEDDDAATSGDGGDADSPPPETCHPYCGGETRETAQPLTLGVMIGDCSACTTPSRWFQFTVESGARFEVLTQTAPGSSVEFLIYAEDGSVVASAGMEADASFAANAATGATYRMRVRAAEGSTGPVGYGLTVQLAAP
jgi:hypothetical protein